jgi:arylsulfatase A-like enzyme
MSALDIFPTCLKAAGGDPSNHPRPLDGVDLLPFLTGTNTSTIHDRLFWHRENIAGIRSKEWKLIQVVDQGIGLFNLDHEPAETNNVASAHLERAQSLATELKAWMDTLSEPTWYEGKGWLPRRAAMHSKEYTATVLPK